MRHNEESPGLRSGDLDFGAGSRVRYAWWHEGGEGGGGQVMQGIVGHMKELCFFSENHGKLLHGLKSGDDTVRFVF